MTEYFIELALPEEIADGVWEVCRADDYAGFLHLDATMHQDVVLSNNLSHGWFPTEMAAQTASITYYNNHGEIYPYELSLSIDSISTENKSQRMEF